MHKLLIILMLTAFSTPLFSQTGFYILEEPDNFLEGKAIVKSNDGHLIVGSEGQSNTTYRKVSADGEIIWEREAEGISHNQYSFKIFAVPGEGYYCFNTFFFTHLSEEGEIIFHDSYPSINLGYGYPDYVSIWFFMQDISFNGTYFDLMATIPTYDDEKNMVYLRIDKEGNIIFNNIVAMPEQEANGQERIVYHDGFLYHIYQSRILADGDSLHIDKINVDDFTKTKFTCYPGFVPEGILVKDDHLIIYGQEERGGLDSLNETILNWNLSTETVEWQKHNEIFYDGLKDNTLKKFIELPDGKFMGLTTHTKDYSPDTMFNRLQTFSSVGDLIYTSPVFFTLTTNTYYSGLSDMVLLDENTLAFSGGQIIPGFLTSPILLVTDTSGNYYHFNITGQLFNDENLNGNYDTGELTFHDKMINTDPSGYIAFTNAEGKYNLLIGKQGEFEIKTDSIAYWNIITPSDHYDIIADAGTEGDTLTDMNFKYDYSVAVHEITVSLHQSEISPGFSSYNNLVIENTGNQLNESGIATIQYPSILNFSSSSPAYDDHSDTILTWNYTDLDPFLPISLHADYTTDVSATIGTETTTIGNIVPDITDLTLTDNSDTVSVIISGAFDPNHLTVAPAGNAPEFEIDHNTTWLTYTIEFQNVGNAPAHFINIYDTLSNLLDFTSIDMLSASHNYQMFLTESNILHWEFDSIMLPDSTSDLMGSMGYLKFKVKIKPEAVIGDIIENTAGIYFDYNPVVLTNTTQTKLADFTLSVFSVHAEQIFNVFPNPASKFITLDLKQNNSHDMYFSISDIKGSVISFTKIAGDQNSVTQDVSHLQNGIYLCSLYDEKNNFKGSVKFEIIR